MIHSPGNDRVIDVLWVVMSEDGKGRNGIVGVSEGEQSFPLVTGNPRMLPRIKELATMVKQKAPDMKFKLYKFCEREMVEEL